MALAIPAHTQSAFEQQNAAMFSQIDAVHGLSAAQLATVKAIFARSGFAGQGNPAIARHPMSLEECRSRAPGGGAGYADPRFERICGAK